MPNVQQYEAIIPRLILFVVFSMMGQTNAVGQNTVHDWPSFLGPDRNSKSGETGIIEDWSLGKLKMAWKAKVGKGYVLGSVAGNDFYQFDAVDSNCRLLCRDAVSGTEKWKFEYPFEYKDRYQFDDGPRASPIVDGDRVYIYGVEGMLHCLKTANGELLWKKNVSKQFGVVQNFFGVGSTPVVHDRFLIVMVGGSPEEDQTKGPRLAEVRPNRTAIVVFDKLTGKVLHSLGDDLASYSSIQLYKKSNKWFGVAWCRSGAIGFDFESGQLLWNFPYRARKFESVNAATPVVKGCQILLTESYGPGSVVLDVADRDVKTIWQDNNVRNRSLASHWSTPVLHEGHVYGCHGESRGGAEIRCVEWATGKVKWNRRGFARSSMTYVDGNLIVLDETGELVLIKATPESFKEITRYTDEKNDKLPIEYPCWAAPIVANGHLYVRGKQKIVCLQIK